MISNYKSAFDGNLEKNFNQRNKYMNDYIYVYYLLTY